MRHDLTQCQLFHVTFPKKSVHFCMPTPCATHLDCAKNSDMLSSIESLVVQKALSDAARAFCYPSHFSKASVVARRSRDPCHNHFFFESAPNTRLSRFSNSKASDAALCPPCLHLAISCQLPTPPRPLAVSLWQLGLAVRSFFPNPPWQLGRG